MRTRCDKGECFRADLQDLVKRAGAGLEAALHMMREPVEVHAVMKSPAQSLREAADAIEWKEAKIRELVALCNELREASK